MLVCAFPSRRKFFLIALFLVSLHTPGFSQSLAERITNLETSASAENFDHEFRSMMVAFRSGNLPFKDEDVLRVVYIAKGKPYADAILPDVYRWAGTMFGNGRMGEAIVYFMESALLYERKNKKLGEALSYFEIALIQHKAENYDEALEYYDRTLELGKDSLDHRTQINCFNGLALIQRERLEHDQAITEFRKALSVAVHHQDTAWIAILSGNIGSIHLRKENYDSSLFYYYKNLELIRKTAEFENEIETYVHIGRVLIKKRNFQKALQYTDSAVAIIHSRKIAFNDFFNPMDYINESYALIYGSMGNYKRAFEYHQRFHEVAQKKQRQLNGRSLKQLQSAFNFTQKQGEVEMLRKVNEANLLVIRQQLYTEIAFASVIILLSVLAFIAFRTGRQRKKLNKELYNSNAELERLNTIKDKLFSVISHDLRGPLGNLQAMLGLFREGQMDAEDFAKVTTKISHQLEVSGNALENLLQWSKAQLSEVSIDPEKVILSELADKVIQQFKEDLGEKKITCVNALTFHMVAWADKNQVEIILRNLIGNAIKFTPAGGNIRVSGKSSNETIEVYIEDSGIGMSETEINDLFQPGRHFSNPGTNQEKGTGIGLLITREMIVNNGGIIRVESHKNKGTRFIFTLPVLDTL
jgi:signal transduction histidine kinase